MEIAKIELQNVIYVKNIIIVLLSYNQIKKKQAVILQISLSQA